MVELVSQFVAQPQAARHAAVAFRLRCIRRGSHLSQLIDQAVASDKGGSS